MNRMLGSLLVILVGLGAFISVNTSGEIFFPVDNTHIVELTGVAG